jgi:predicted hydrocarbon binding protein
MSEKYDFKKEWPNIKKKLVSMSQEAIVLAKKGEEELVKFSQKSKLHIDATSLNLKKEKLFYQIGKEYVKAKCPAAKTAKLTKFMEELAQIEKEERVLRRRINAAGKK